MHRTARIKRHFLAVFLVTLVSVGVVFATAGAQATPEAVTITANAQQTAQPVAAESEPAPELPPKKLPAEPVRAQVSAPAAAPSGTNATARSAKARLVANAIANGEPLQYSRPAARAEEQGAAPETTPTQPAAVDGAANIDTAAVQNEDLVLLDTFIATAYCLTGTTSTGTYTTVGRTLAVNPGIIPYGTHVWIYLEDGTFVGDYYAEDTGANMMEHPYVVDIYMGEDSYDACINWGAQRVLIYVEAE